MFQSKYMKKAKANKQKNSKLALFVFFDTKLFLCSTTPQYPGFYKSIFYIILIKIKGLILMIYIFFIQKKKKERKKSAPRHALCFFKKHQKSMHEVRFTKQALLWLIEVLKPCTVLVPTKLKY